MKVSALVASGGCGLITPVHIPPILSFLPSILYWDPIAPALALLLAHSFFYSHFGFFLFFHLPTTVALSSFPLSTICLSPLVAQPFSWKCHNFQRGGCSNLDGRLKLHCEKLISHFLSPMFSNSVSFSCTCPSHFILPFTLHQLNVSVPIFVLW